MPKIVVEGEYIIDGNTIVLLEKKLPALTEVVRDQEVNHITQMISFSSEMERRQYLDDSRETSRKGRDLLAEAVELKNRGPVEPDHFDDKQLVAEYLAYIEYAVGLAFTTLKNLHLRKEYLTKVGFQAEFLTLRIKRIRETTPVDVELLHKATVLMDEFTLFKDATYKCLVKKADPSSQSFSRLLKSRGTSFGDVVAEYHNKLKAKDSTFDKPFDELVVEKQIEVYNEILKASGRSSFLSNSIYKTIEISAKAVLVFTLGMSVWDVYSSEHKIQTAVKETAEFTVGYYGGNFGEALSSTILNAIVESGVIPVSAITPAYVGLAVFAAGFGFGTVLAIGAGWVVDQIFASGGKHAGGAIVVDGQPPPPPPQPVSGSHVHVAPMPDGDLLARQIAFQDNIT